MSQELKIPPGPEADSPDETPEDRARRVAEIKRLVQSGRYRADSREILFNMLKTAP